MEQAAADHTVQAVFSNPYAGGTTMEQDAADHTVQASFSNPCAGGETMEQILCTSVNVIFDI